MICKCPVGYSPDCPVHFDPMKKIYPSDAFDRPVEAAPPEGKCDRCDGFGTIPANDDAGIPAMNCGKCDGTGYRPPTPEPAESEGKPCPNCKETADPCRCMRNKCQHCGEPVGNITFACCDDCWDKKHPPTAPPSDATEDAKPITREGLFAYFDQMTDPKTGRIDTSADWLADIGMLLVSECDKQCNHYYAKLLAERDRQTIEALPDGWERRLANITAPTGDLLLRTLERLEAEGRPLDGAMQALVTASVRHSHRDLRALAARVKELEAAINSVLPHFESHQVYDKGSEGILRKALGGKE